MKGLIIGIDIGGSTTKAVALQNDEILGYTAIQSLEPVAAASGALGKLLFDLRRSPSDVELIAVTGVGSRGISDRILDLPARKVDEITAIGIGGLALTGRREALVVSIGTGTALVAAYEGGKRIVHVGGTGVGGGTLQGLSRLLLRTQSIASVERLAEKGDLSKIDLTVEDLAGGGVGRVPGYATASNFGKLLDEANESDIAAGIINLVGQVIGIIAIFAAKAYGLEHSVAIVGRLAQSPNLVRSISNVGSLFQVSFMVPEKPDFCTAIGAAKWVQDPKNLTLKKPYTTNANF
ncbi:MAG: pantothenate kinase [Candidatus Bathyarchaeia archaeon]